MNFGVLSYLANSSSAIVRKRVRTQADNHMGKTELAAHLFRITQTSEKIEREDIRGQRDLEQAAHQVGQKVRSTMQELGGVSPEDLPPAENINQVRKKLKGTNKQLKSLDQKKS